MNEIKIYCVIQFCFMMANGENQLKMCRNCGMAFAAKDAKDEFCSEKCRKEYNGAMKDPGEYDE